MLADGKVAIITGGANGIGKGIVKCFTREGAKVVIADRSEEDGIRLCDQLNREGAEALFVRMDLKNEVELDQTVQQTMDRFGRIDVLINNAGRSFYKPIEELTAADFDSLVSSDFRGMYLLTGKVIPSMKEQGGGSIVHISSVHAFRTAATHSLYAGIKGGMMSATRAMAQELGRYGIRVNVIMPGMIQNRKMDEQFLKSPGPRFKLGRIGEPEDVGNAAVFLSSHMASYITGTSLVVDGGQTLQL